MNFIKFIRWNYEFVVGVPSSKLKHVSRLHPSYELVREFLTVLPLRLRTHLKPRHLRTYCTVTCLCLFPVKPPQTKQMPEFATCFVLFRSFVGRASSLPKKVWQNYTFPLSSPLLHAIQIRFWRSVHISDGTGMQQEAPMQGDVSDKDGRPVISQTK